MRRALLEAAVGAVQHDRPRDELATGRERGQMPGEELALGGLLAPQIAAGLGDETRDRHELEVGYGWLAPTDRARDGDAGAGRREQLEELGRDGLGQRQRDRRPSAHGVTAEPGSGEDGSMAWAPAAASRGPREVPE